MSFQTRPSKKNLEKIKNKDIFEKKEEKLCTIFFKSQEIRNEIAHSLGKKTKIINDIGFLRNSIKKLKKIIYDRKFISYYENKYSNGLLEK